MITIIDAKRFPASDAWKKKCSTVANFFSAKDTSQRMTKIKEVHLCDHVQMMLPPLLPHLEKRDADNFKLKSLFESKVWIPGVPVCAEYIEGFIELSVYNNLIFQWQCEKNCSIPFTLFYSCEGEILELKTYDYERINPIGKDCVDRQRFLLRLKNGGWL